MIFKCNHLFGAKVTRVRPTITAVSVATQLLLLLFSAVVALETHFSNEKAASRWRVVAVQLFSLVFNYNFRHKENSYSSKREQAIQLKTNLIHVVFQHHRRKFQYIIQLIYIQKFAEKNTFSCKLIKRKEV